MGDRYISVEVSIKKCYYVGPSTGTEIEVNVTPNSTELKIAFVYTSCACTLDEFFKFFLSMTVL